MRAAFAARARFLLCPSASRHLSPVRRMWYGLLVKQGAPSARERTANASSITIGLVVAMRMEARPLLRLVGGQEAERIGRLRAWAFHAGPCRCVLVLSGMGIEPARKAARALIESANPNVIVSFGIAGALGGGLAIGDILLGERCRLRENGRLGPALELTTLAGAVHRAASKEAEARNARCRRGAVITVRGIHITASGNFSMPVAPDGAAVVEMETAGVAEVAAERGIPLISIRAVSDSPEEPIPFAMGGGEEFHIRPFTLLGAVLRDPRIIGALLRLKRNSKLAARNLAEVVKAVIDLQEVQSIGSPDPPVPVRA